MIFLPPAWLSTNKDVTYNIYHIPLTFSQKFTHLLDSTCLLMIVSINNYSLTAFQRLLTVVAWSTGFENQLEQNQRQTLVKMRKVPYGTQFLWIII